MFKKDWQLIPNCQILMKAALSVPNVIAAPRFVRPGINLQDLWLASKDDLALQGPSAPYQQVRNRVAFGQPDSQSGRESVAAAGPKPCLLDYAGRPASFSACIQCGTCTNVCPVVADYQQDPQLMGYLDLLPSR